MEYLYITSCFFFRETDPIPSAIYVSSLFNPKALFLLLKFGNVPIKEVFNSETFRNVCDFYSSHK